MCYIIDYHINISRVRVACSSVWYRAVCAYARGSFIISIFICTLIIMGIVVCTIIILIISPSIVHMDAGVRRL